MAMVNSLIQCNYKFASENWPNWPKSYMFGSQDVLYKYCGSGKYKSNLAMCSEPLFLESLCSQYPFQFTRTVRLRKKNYISVYTLKVTIKAHFYKNNPNPAIDPKICPIQPKILVDKHSLRLPTLPSLSSPILKSDSKKSDPC